LASTGHFHVLDRPPHLAGGFFKRLAAFPGDCAPKLIHFRFQQAFEFEQVLDALLGWSTPSGWQGL